MTEPTPIGTTAGNDPQTAVTAIRRDRLSPPPADPPPPRSRPPSVPARYAYRLGDLEPTAAVAAAASWLDRVRADRDDDRGLLILGKVGRGKSAIAGALAVEAQAPSFAQFWPTIDLLGRLRDEFDDPRDRKPIKTAIAERRLLVLDDVGSERPTDWTVGQLTEVVSAAYDDRRLLVVTSNLTPEQLSDHLGERTLSRLREMTELLVVDGPDRRGAS